MDDGESYAEQLKRMTYREYLNRWNENFGDAADIAETVIYKEGKKRPYSIYKLNREQFNHHKWELIRIDEGYQYAIDTDDEEKAEKLLREAFLYEVSLLL